MKDAPAIVVLTRKHYPYSNIILGVVIYFIGFLIYLFYKAPSSFLRMPYFYIGTFGIIFVSLVLSWGFASLEAVTNELKSALEIKESELKLFKYDFIRHISSDKRIFLFSIPGYFFAVYHFWLIYNNIISFPFGVPIEFYNSIWMIAYVLIFLGIVVYLIFASAYIIVYAIVFLKKLTQFPFNIDLLQVKRRVRLEKTVTTILKITIYWFIGVSLIMTILYVYAGIIILLFLVFVVAVGLMFFFVPMFLFSHSIKMSKEKLLTEIRSEFSRKIKIPLPPEYDVMEALLLCALFDEVEKISDWTFETNTLFKIISSILIPVITALIGIISKMYT